MVGKKRLTREDRIRMTSARLANIKEGMRQSEREKARRPYVWTATAASVAVVIIGILAYQYLA